MEVIIDGIKYELNLDTQSATVISSTPKYEGDINIPSCVAHSSIEFDVTSIGDEAFFQCSALTSITIPDTVTSIGHYAFKNCSALNAIIIPNSVMSIGKETFSHCSALTSIVWNARKYKNFYSSYDTPFCNIRSQITSFAFGDSVEHIPAHLCNGMNNLTSVTIPISVTSIADWAFQNCSALTSITIPERVTSIGKYSLNGCTALTSIIWNATDYSTWDKTNHCPVSPFYEIRSQITSFIFGEKVEHIPAAICCGMKNLTSVTIPNGVTFIGNKAFSGCFSLTSVIWNAKEYTGYFQNYSDAPFYDARSNVTSFTFGDEVEVIPAYLCYGMNSLTSIVIPSNVYEIGKEAFWGCLSLQSVVWNAKQLFRRIVQIGVGEDAKIYSNMDNFAFFASSAEKIISFEFGNEVVVIPRDLCKGMSSLKSIVIPQSVTTIGENAFAGCFDLASITLENGITNIGDAAFSCCTSLTTITIPKGVTSIGICLLGERYSLQKIFVPIGKKEEYCELGLEAYRSLIEEVEKTEFQSDGNEILNIETNYDEPKDCLDDDVEYLKEAEEMISEAECCDKTKKGEIYENENPKEEYTILLNIAKGYEHGIGITKNLAQAVLLYSQAANQGCAEAAYHLGELYEKGKGLPLDYQQAIDWYAKAVSLYHPSAEERKKHCEQILQKEK